MATDQSDGTEATLAGHVGHRAPQWGLADVLAGALIGFFMSGLLAGIWVAVFGGDATGLGALAAGQVGLWLGLIGAPVVAARTRGSGSPVTDFGFRVRPLDALGAPVGLACQLVVVPLLYLLIELLTGDLDVGAPARELTERAHGAGWVLLALLIVVGAPVAEELFFRGLVLRTAQRRWGTGWALAISSLAFAASHFQVVQFPGLAVTGLVFGLLAVRTGRLGTSIAAHMAFNATAFVSIVLR